MEQQKITNIKSGKISDIGEIIISYPYFFSIVEPLLVFIYENGGDARTVKAGDTYEPLADYFNLSEIDRTRTHDDIYKNGRNAIYWGTLVQRAKDCVYLRYIMPAPKGIWTLTQQGVRVAEEIIIKRELYTSLPQSTITEGSRKIAISKRYERSIVAREICINKHGYRCAVCDIDFVKKYGSIGKDYIHVHHKVSLSDIAEEHIVKPEIDLVPVCPNCHAMLHRREPPFTIEELKKMMVDIAEEVLQEPRQA
jgi:5-methylcytosine-specific restriction protein A